MVMGLIFLKELIATLADNDLRSLAITRRFFSDGIFHNDVIFAKGERLWAKWSINLQDIVREFVFQL
jgi:hypothetical protein